MDSQLLRIGGKAVPGRGGVLEVLDPWDQSIAARVHLATAADVELALAAAAAAVPVLRKSAASDRAAWLEGMAAGIARRRDEIADQLRTQAGKPITMARTEVDRAVITFRTGAEEARRIGGEMIPLDLSPVGAGRFGVTRRVPRGVVSGIVPFNFPLNLAAHKVAPALAAGCPIILKPPPQAPGPVLLLAEIAAEAGVPDGGVNALLAPISAAGALVTDPRIAVISFTGSAAVGWGLKARAGEKMTILELGGNGAVIVDETADLSRAAERCALAAFGFAGQVCTKAQRLIVAREVYDEFRRLLLDATARLVKVGNPVDPEVVAGPVIDDVSADRIESWVKEAVAAGAIAVRPLERNGRLLSPCILEKVPNGAHVRCDEIFGPVVLLDPFDTFEEAIAQVNDSRYGLQAGLFTKRLDRARKAFDDLDVGAIIIDDAPVFRIDSMPYGGVKSSGFGREGLRWAIEEMTELRMLVMPPG